MQLIARMHRAFIQIFRVTKIAKEIKFKGV